MVTRRRALSIIGSAAATAWLAACGGETASKPSPTTAPTASPTPAPFPLRLAVPDPQIAVRAEFVAPKDTDPAIDTALEPHYVVLSSATASRGRLFLFLPGTGTNSEVFKLLAQQGARNGFNVVVLRYPNSDAVQALCGQDPDTSCFEKARLEVIDGTDRTPKVNVSRANSIENRLVKLLAYLETKHPNEGWATFVDAGAPKWSSIVVAGHSQGGGHAALIARDHIVPRVAMFSSPVDHLGPIGRQTDSSPAAPWLLGAHQTPSAAYFSFGHAKDENNNWDLQWKALGLGMSAFGAPANVDGATPPYGGAHLLTTRAAPQKNSSNAPNHGSTAHDLVTPLSASGQPVFAPVWQYVCFA